MTKFKDKIDAIEISNKNGAEWCHLWKMSLITLMTSLKEN